MIPVVSSARCVRVPNGMLHHYWTPKAPERFMIGSAAGQRWPNNEFNIWVLSNSDASILTQQMEDELGCSLHRCFDNQMVWRDRATLTLAGQSQLSKVRYKQWIVFGDAVHKHEPCGEFCLLPAGTKRLEHYWIPKAPGRSMIGPAEGQRWT